MMTGLNELKTLTKHIWCKFRCRFDGKKCNSNQWWNNDVDVIVKKFMYVKKIVWNLATCNCENWKHLASIMDDEMIICDKFYIQKKKNLMKKITCKTQNFYILLAFLLTTITLLIAVSIYCYLIKYWTKHYHFTT